MQSIAMFFLFVGVFLIVIGIYEEKLRIAESNVKIEYKFIPRTYYEEQLANSDLSMKMADLFNNESPWFDRTVGALSDLPERNKKGLASAAFA